MNVGIRTIPFRLQFSLDDNDDSKSNYLKIFSGDDLDELNQPKLVIEYFMLP